MRSSSISSGQTTLLLHNAAECGNLTIGKRGVLLSVLGNELMGTEVTAQLDKLIKKRLDKQNPFYNFNVEKAERSQLCVSYNEVSNTVFIIGITDVFVGFATAQEINKENVKSFGVKLKKTQDSTLQSNHLILARLEGKIGSTQKIAFYLLEEPNR